MKKRNITMKIMIAIVAILFSANIFAQAETEKVKIKTSAQCLTCKANIEKALNANEGVKSASMNPATKIVTVNYDGTQLTESQIRKIITMAGYDADDLPADAASYEKLDACCKKDGGH
ncbi:MAG: cation transporter [Chitinophagales bacterium]|nr:cation transporter [Chitinophagales bacterium]